MATNRELQRRLNCRWDLCQSCINHVILMLKFIENQKSEAIAWDDYQTKVIYVQRDIIERLTKELQETNLLVE